MRPVTAELSPDRPRPRALVGRWEPGELPEIVAGETVAALEKQSERLDLLVLGSRGYGPLARVLLGSVSRKLANRAHCPVLVVPRGVRALDGSDATEPGASTLATPPAARS
ncbi:MAG TPA: universal stress protein [Solirubrobacteraceae bacterium]